MQLINYGIDISPDTQKAFDHLNAFFNRLKLDGGILDKGIQTMLDEQVCYTPEAWKQRGEEYGTSGVLVIVHEGGLLAPYFSMDCMAYPLIEEMREHLDQIDMYAEQCTTWYSAIYNG